MSKLKRYDIKKLLADPAVRRSIICRGTHGLNQLEGIDLPISEVYRLYDESKKRKDIQ